MEKLELINKYLDNLLDPSESEAFETELRNSPELQEELKVAKATRAAMEIWQIESLKEEFGTYSKKKSNLEGRRRFLYRVGYASAAAVVLLLLGLWLTAPKEIDLDTQMAEALSLDTQSTLKGPDSNTENEYKDTILSFFEVYESGSDEALSQKLNQLETFIAEDSSSFVAPRQKALALYMGAGYYKLKEYVKARAYFEQAKLSRHSDIAEEILNAPIWKEQGL